MRYEDLRPDHLRRINPKPSQQGMQQTEEPENPIWYTGPGWAGVDDDGTVFAIVGMVALDNYGRYRAWTLLCDDMGTRRLKFVARNIRLWLDKTGDYRRIEALSVVDAEDELFWMRNVLRLHVEGRMKAWMPDGSDVYLFSRVKGRD